MLQVASSPLGNARLERRPRPGCEVPGLACGRCGQRENDLDRSDAVIMTRLVKRRCVGLFVHPVGSLRERGPKGPWSPMASVLRACSVLAAANRDLCQLVGTEAPKLAPAQVHASSAGAILASVVENADRLIATIDVATAARWESARLGPAAAEMVRLALHDANHHLEDAELPFRALARAAHPAGSAA